MYEKFDDQLALMLYQFDDDLEDTKHTEPIPEITNIKIATSILPHFINEDECMAMFIYLKENIKWQEGIQTRSGGHTRLAAMGNEDRNVHHFIQKIKRTLPFGKFQVVGIYLNYQRNGTEYTPTHCHQNGFQQVICLGPAKRKFTIGNKHYIVGNGDVIVFGSDKHGLPKDTKCKEERISIATFYLPI
jgi:hypothetical protein